MIFSRLGVDLVTAPGRKRGEKWGSRKEPMSCSVPEVYEVQENMHGCWPGSGEVLVPDKIQVIMWEAGRLPRRD